MRKIIIINDNSKDIILIQDYISVTPGVAVVGTFTTLAEAAPMLNENKYDILIAGLPVLNSLTKEKAELPVWVCLGEVQEMLLPQLPKNIFAYLNSPFSYERVFSLLQNIESYMLQLSNNTSIKREYIFIKSEYKLIKINLSDILFLSGLRDYTQVFLKGKISPLTTLQNLKDFESKLPETAFIRVHRSYIVSLSQVDSISRNEITIGTYTIPIGHAYRQLLDDMISKNS
jgi:DNA-binding LytR/AlgR family response regulator